MYSSVNYHITHGLLVQPPLREEHSEEGIVSSRL